MKTINKINSSILLILAINNLMAQNIPLLPIHNAHWEYESSDPGGMFHEHQYIIGDTIIGDTIFTKFVIDKYEYTNNPEGGEFYGSSEFWIYIIDGAIYSRNRFTQQLLIFDSNWAVGDTIYDMLNLADTIIVASIDTIQIGGIERREWSFKSILSECNHCSAGFIEGIGNTSYNLAYPSYHMFWEGGSSLICCWLENENIVNDYCRFKTDIMTNEIFNAINVFPNPTSDILRIEIIPETVMDASITIFNSRGVNVLQQKNQNNIIEVEISKFPPGMYIVNVLKGKHRWQESFIIY